MRKPKSPPAAWIRRSCRRRLWNRARRPGCSLWVKWWTSPAIWAAITSNGPGPPVTPPVRAYKRLPRLVLGSGEVTGDLVLADGVDHHLVRLARLAGVELHRLVDVLVAFFGELIVCHHFDGVLVLFGIGLLQQESDITHALAVLGFAELELDVIALAQTLEGGKL